jgi:hypothetical protein
VGLGENGKITKCRQEGENGKKKRKIVYWQGGKQREKKENPVLYMHRIIKIISYHRKFGLGERKISPRIGKKTLKRENLKRKRSSVCSTAEAGGGSLCTS